MNRFVKTSIACAIGDAIAYARAMERAAAIIGPAGIGKTVALENEAKNERHAIYWRVTTPERTERAALRVFADRLGLAPGADSSAKIWRSIEAWMEAYGRSAELYLLIDEAQILDLNLLKELVDLPSRFGFPVIACGNPDLLKRTRVSTGPYEQIASRCSKRVILSKPLEKDFIDIAIDFDVFGADARAAIVAYGLNTSIREVVHLLEDAREYAGKGPLRLDEIRHAVVTNKGGPKALSLLKPAA